ncbi:mannose 6-phosphate receptor domain-containing protein [Xylariaceae sp. FL0255]|nr:mannose 6-phosphate receptor domain-containing protein [Xylariaceae sp. FL0255]
MRPLSTSSPVYPAFFALLSLPTTGLAASDAAQTSTTATACTASSTSGAFFDLRPDAAIKPKPDGSRPSNSRGAPLTDYHARGYDYGFNFTLNICNAVVDPIKDVKGIESNMWQNISAYYYAHAEYYSLGFQSGNLVTRGKELVLQYTGGSPCGKSSRLSDSWGRAIHDRSAIHEGASYRDYEAEEETTTSPSTTTKGAGWPINNAHNNDDVRRKSATIFFTCDRDVVNGNAVVSFIAVDPDECSYVFKAKSAHACASAEPHKPGSVGPGSVFAIILVIAVLVYVVGGVFYNRTVENARGWRQLPNYSLWSGLWSFVCDMFIIATASCARLFLSRRGYHSLAGSMNGRGRNSRDDENRLIDQYDEEWED